MQLSNLANMRAVLAGLPTRAKPGHELSTGSDDLAPIVMGFTFRPMDDDDYMGLAGADSGSYICEPEGTDIILVLSPEGDAITVVNVSEGTEQVWRLQGVR